MEPFQVKLEVNSNKTIYLNNIKCFLHNKQKYKIGVK